MNMEMLATLLPIFLTILLGHLCRRFRILKPEGIATLKKVAANLTLPASALSAFASVDYSPRNLWMPVWVVIASCLMLAMGYAAQRLLRLPGKTVPYLMTGFEGGMLGFSLYPMLYGNLAPLAMPVIGNVFFIFTIYKVLLSQAKGPKAQLKEALTSPSIWALVLGLLIGATGLYKAMEPSGARALFTRILSYMSAPTSYLILLAIGYELDLRSVAWGKVGVTVLCRMVICGVMLAVTLLLNRFVMGGTMEISAAVMLFILPAPFVVTVFAKNDSEQSYLSSCLSVMTLVTVLAFAGMILFMK